MGSFPRARLVLAIALLGNEVIEGDKLMKRELQI
jgi:hypothetical protein